MSQNPDSPKIEDLQRCSRENDRRQHFEHIMDKWGLLLNDTDEIGGVVTKTLSEGGTRPAWSGVEFQKKEYILMAWPRESLLRSAVIVSGPKDEQLAPVAVFPLMEGIPNLLTIEDVYNWKNGVEGEVSVSLSDQSPLLWFYDPLFFRDRNVDLTEGVAQTFVLSGLCFGIRRALVDELTVTEGPAYEAHAQEWLKNNPDKGRLDVPPLKYSLKGTRILSPTDQCSLYQGRGEIVDVDSFDFGPEGAEVKIYRFVMTFGDVNPIHILMYAPEKACQNGYVPKTGHEIDLMFWLQGRIIDIDENSFSNTANVTPAQ